MQNLPHFPRPGAALRRLRGLPAALLGIALLLPAYAPAQPTAAASAPASAPDVIQPNANLLVQGIPPIPRALAERAERYTRFAGRSAVAWHPTKRELIVAMRPRDGNTVQLFRLDGPGALPQQLTRASDPTSRASYEPRAGRYLIVERSAGGSEAYQIYRYDFEGGGRETRLSEPDERHSFAGWTHRGDRLLYASVPLDRTAGGGTRARVSTRLTLLDPLAPDAPGARRVVAELEGGGWGGFRFSHDDRQLLATRYVSANESEVHLIDVESGKPRRLLPADDAAPGVALTHDARGQPDGVLFLSDRDGEFRELMHQPLAAGAKPRSLTKDLPWDVSGAALADDGSLLAAVVNVAGRGELRLWDGKTFAPLPLPEGLPAGNSIGAVRLHRGEPLVAVNSSGAASPGEVHVFGRSGAAGFTRAERWAQAETPAGVDTASFAPQQIVRWTSFDGREISGLLSLPPAERFPGKRPVVVNIHGGPESQATIGFLGRAQYFIQELGIAMIQPNVRGSSGFGKTFLALDNGMLREDAVKDIGALLDWIERQPNLDARRVLVMGGSYGGYMSLATAVHYAERIAGAIDVVGISHFVTFLESTESYRRDLRRVEYGDERDPQMRAFLHRISPLTNAHKITKPLFVIQGKNDPRVPYTEAEQIVERARANPGAMVWYLRADNEGHGFARRENADFQFYAMLRFMQETILKP